MIKKSISLIIIICFVLAGVVLYNTDTLYASQPKTTYEINNKKYIRELADHLERAERGIPDVYAQRPLSAEAANLKKEIISKPLEGNVPQKLKNYETILSMSDFNLGDKIMTIAIISIYRIFILKFG